MRRKPISSDCSGTWSTATAGSTFRLVNDFETSNVKENAMTKEQANVAKECAELSASGKIHFGEVVGRLTKAGIERYHADYSRMENTYYAPDGGSCVVPMEHEPMPIAQDFSPA